MKAYTNTCLPLRLFPKPAEKMLKEFSVRASAVHSTDNLLTPPNARAMKPPSAMSYTCNKSLYKNLPLLTNVSKAR